MCISTKFGGLLDSDKMAKAKILVVEDEAITAMDIQNRLKELDYDVPAIASSGEGAIKRVEEIEPDLVVMDIILKGMDGIEAAERIRDRFDIPVVYVTASLDEARLEKTKVTEPYGYIIKPFEDKELRPVIEMALQRHKLEKALRESESQYRSIFDSATDSFLIFDTDGNIVEANIQACKMYGYPYEELIKLSGKDIVHRDYYHLFEQFKRDVQRTGEFHAESVDVRKDGSTFDIEVRGTLFNYKYKPHLLAVIRDITERKKTEEALKESQRYTRGLIEASLDPLVTISSEGKITDVNPATELVTGYPREKLIGTVFSDYFSDPQKARQGYQQVFEEGNARDYPLEIKHRDGKVTPVLYNASVYYDAKGDVAGVFAAARDITERKKTEELLRTAEQDWRNSFNSLEDVMLITDRDYNIENINECGLKLLGKSKEEVIGQKCYQVISGVDSPGEDCPCMKSLETKKVESLDRYEEVFGKYYSIKCSPIFDENGEIIKFVDLKRDITERTHLMMERDNAKMFLESVIENIPDAVYLKDSQYRYSLVNQAYCDLFEVKKEEIIRKERVYETDKEIFQTGKAVEIQEQSFTDHTGCPTITLQPIEIIR